MANVSFNSFSKFKLFISKKIFIKIFKTRTLIQVFLFVGGENGILVKKYLKIPISPLRSISSKIPKTPLKIGTFQNPKSRGGENGMIFPGGENGISRLTPTTPIGLL